ncbi:Conserved_hypothetical protein [Hexamita inflata]|uniref:Transmembrane protein n=1 Tax=Hexamita inflata TaxID=28002 RepID=A0AA86UX94_9EUKA|nr:Conserved hypothetical protein [Hexamita inflata]
MLFFQSYDILNIAYFLTTSADINLFADTLQITVTLTSTKSSSCDIPHGVFVSLQIDSLGSYEPSAYVQDFAYDSPQQIRLACTDPVECAKIKAAESGTVVLETKTHATFVPAGSIRVSKGLSSSCFHDNDSFVELYQGAVVLVLYPTFTCKDSIAKDQMGQLKLNTLSKVKMYITYTDNSISIHDQLALSVEQDIFIPSNQISTNSLPVRIKLSNPTLSQYFVQQMVNGKVSKDLMLFQLNLEYIVDDIKKNVQITMNFYKLMGIVNAYNKFDFQLLSNGFISYKQPEVNINLINNQLIQQGITHFTIQYIFMMYDVPKTEQFRMRLISKEQNDYLYNNNPVQYTCEWQFPDQQCDLLLYKLKNIPITELQGQVNYQFYSNSILITNYTKMIDNIYDSCFTDGLLDYNANKLITQITINSNTNSKYCSLAKNDALVVKILLGNNSQILKTFNNDFIPGIQRFQITGVNLALLPEIRIQFYRDNSLQDAVALNKYVIYKDNQLITQEIHIILFILLANLIFVILYQICNITLYKIIKQVLTQRKQQKQFKQFIIHDEAQEI